MTPEMVLDIGKEAGTVLVLLATPPLLTGLAIGVLVGMIQAATSVQEMTLTFIPKLLGVFTAMLISGHWMLATITDYTTGLYDSIPTLVG
ncbi:flagellar biosynthesis protein FliQ [Thiorhodovibrio frisius]|uniref:Flagellar biosynthetic protein FliQ n=1 Tax=Thiorhodovibrio frisius TaxID=631362 RepID=H8YZM1_9GAMM|nr:flagellar biosynthesis protein FliQ [Thiorhodovibrio frisius]EIC22148.1 flagellar biosynthetic protein FliQ [Thiorhodovibrio frisius]WPL24442.1 Flagellar biosynthetic protein FliQ [Thiorhodovibrio frisius]